MPSFVAETCEQIVREQLPNLFRLYLNPYVAQTCFCLDRYVHTAWPKTGETFQTFLANGFDEALSGAIKLARYSASLAGRPTTGLVIDPDNRLGPFASASIAQGRVEFLPGLVLAGRASDEVQPFGFVVLITGSADQNAELAFCQSGMDESRREGEATAEPLSQRPPAEPSSQKARQEPRPPAEPSSQKARQEPRPPATHQRTDYDALVGRLVQQGALVIACVGRSAIRDHQSAILPDIVVFDESFVNREVPFGAFSARKPLYDQWNTAAKSTFHSTTFQPNTISSLHFMRCLAKDDPKFHAAAADELRLIETDLQLRKQFFRNLYSPSLAGVIAATGFEMPNVRAEGDFVFADDRQVFDGVSGVACSVRGHNPPSYPAEMEALAGVDCAAEVAERLRDLTGLEHVLPATSGATAVEVALKIALVAQYPKRHVLALKSGFGGKTLFALTGTWNASYKEHIDPLYADVLYVDPFAADAIAQIDAALAAHPVAVVQAELIQGVGGVRRVPEAVIRHLASSREKHGYLLLIDEVQTGMYRTGPFTLSRAMGLNPDLLVVGKAVSDMMFPFALMLYSARVQAKLDQAGSDLPAVFRQRYGYEFGYRTVLNVLRLADTMHLSDRVAESGRLFERCLKEVTAGCKNVRDVRVFGLLIGIELEKSAWPQRWFKKRLFQFYLAAMLRHPTYPVLVGYCQYEPNVLKITPPLTVEPAVIRKVCATIGEVLRRPFYQLLASAVGGLLFGSRRKKHDHPIVKAHEPVLR